MEELREPQAEKELWYKDGLQFECQECGSCCGGAPGYVWVTEDEINRLADRFGMDFMEFQHKFVRRVGTRKSLNELPNCDCVFLDRFHGTCTVYEDRPLQCRTWPFWDSNLETEADWERASRACRGCNRGKLYNLGEIEERKNLREF